MRSLILLLAALTFHAGAEERPGLPVRTELQVQTSDHVTLRVVRLGTATVRPPVLLVSGWTIGLEVWEPVAATLARNREVYLFDSRSQGRSSVSQEHNTPEDRGRDLAALIDKLHLRHPLVVAWSQGVQDLAAYVLERGDGALSGSVLVDTLPSGGAADIVRDPASAKLVMERLSLYRRAPEEYTCGMMQFIISRGDTKQIRTSLARIATATPPSIGADMLVSDLFGVDRSGARFIRPVLVIAGGSTPDAASQARFRTWAFERQARFCSIDAAAHAVFVDQPTTFLATVLAWEANIDGTAKSSDPCQ